LKLVRTERGGCFRRRIVGGLGDVWTEVANQARGKAKWNTPSCIPRNNLLIAREESGKFVAIFRSGMEEHQGKCFMTDTLIDDWYHGYMALTKEIDYLP
jgi:hypothetical protein